MSNSERDLCTCGINQASFEKERFVITNFAKFLSTPFKNKFDLIVIDDSHGFENAVEDQFQHQVAYDRVDDLFKRHDVAGDIVGEVTGNLMDIFDDIIAAVPPSELTRRVPDDDIKKIGEIKGSEELPSTLRNLEEIDRDIYLDLFYFIKKCRDLTQNTFYVQKDFYNPLSLRDADLLSRKSDRYIDNVMRMIFGEARVLLVSAYPGKIEEHATYSTRRKHPADRIQVVPKDKPEEVKRWFRNLSLFEVTDVNDPIESGFENCVNLTSEILQKSKVKSLLLFKNYRDQRRAEISLKQKVKGRKITFIDDTFETEKVQSLVEEADVIMVSASSRLWEGINISGLKLEIIFSLPFIRPPVYLDRTRSFPYVRRKMLVRLQQGIGRLIRDPDDRGVCVVLDYANRPTNQTTLSNHVNSRDFSPRIARQDIASEQRPRFRESVRKPDQRIAPSMNTTTTDIDSPRQVLRATYNVNLFELKQYKPLSVSRFHVTVSPRAERPGHFYQVLGRFARKLTKELSTAVISEGGEILVLESPNADPRLSDEIAIEDVGTFRVQLTDANTSLVNFADSPLEYERLVSRIIDIALVQFAPDYYKYHDLSPHIIERGQGFFPQSLREKIGVEDGRQFYRGLRVVDGLPHVLVNRAIQLRSWKHLLNELKVLANWFAESRGIEVDFYNPPDAFVKFANWSFRNRTANNRMYSAR